MFGPQEKQPAAVIARQGTLFTAGSPEYDTWTFGKTPDEALANLKTQVETRLFNQYGRVVELPDFDVHDNTDA